MSTIWKRLGLIRNPFFQEPLEEGAPDANLTRFFVARERDRTDALTQLTHDAQTRVVMTGGPGVGKTTLLNRLLADLKEDAPDRQGWLVPELKPVNLPGATTLTDFCVEVLRQVLDLRRRDHEARSASQRRVRRVLDSAGRAAQQARAAVAPGQDIWEVVTRAVHGATMYSPQAAGFGFTTQHIAPTPSAASWVPLTQAALATLVQESGRDVLIAVNNAENLARAAAERAQDVLLNARDLFLVPNVHWLFVGTPDFFDHVIAPRRQLAGVMQHPLRLAPLGPDDVSELIARRYAELRDPTLPFIEPVALETAVALSRVFVGDLRELLRALEMAVLRLAPLGAQTVSMTDAMKVISQQQRELLRDRMQGAAWEHLARVVLGPSADAPLVQRFREADAVRRLTPMRQPTVNAHKRQWLADGFVRADGRTGVSEWFTVAGEALLAMLPDAEAQGKPLEALLAGRDLETDPLPDQPVARGRRRGRSQ